MQAAPPSCRSEGDSSTISAAKTTEQTGCKVNTKDGATSDDMIDLISTGQYDGVSASGNASVRLMKRGDVAPVNTKLIPNYADVAQGLKNQDYNSLDGQAYGVPHGRGPNLLMWRTDSVTPAPTSWSVIYSPKYKGKITVPDNPIQIADAALYLSKSQPSLKITDPYELNSTQFNAAVKLLSQQKPLIKKYWALASDEIDLFKNGDAVVGASWPYQTNTLIGAKAPVKDLIPKEGATGWADTWMMSAHAKHPNCMYKWMAWVSTAKVQAQQAIYFGETPANPKACSIMNKLSPGSAAQYHCGASASYFASIKFWKTPVAACGNGQNDCMDYTKWQQAWTQLKG